jgi:hypothetical protein
MRRVLLVVVFNFLCLGIGNKDSVGKCGQERNHKPLGGANDETLKRRACSQTGGLSQNRTRAVKPHILVDDACDSHD